MSNIIHFTPSTKQWRAYELLNDSSTNFIGYGGSARSGKSYLLAYWLTISCLTYPDTGWGLGRKELKNLKRTTLLTLFKVFDECGLVKDKHYKYNQQNQVIRFYNKSEIFLIDMAYQPSDPLFTRFGGLELTGAAIDESNESVWEAIQTLFTRIGWRNNDTYNLGRKMLETFNPDKGHVYRRYYKPYKDNTELDNVKFIPALPEDNPHPSTKDWIEDMKKNADTVTKERLLYGNFEYDDDPSKLINYETILDIFSNTFVQPGNKYITADIARFGKDRTVIMLWDGFRVEQIVTMDRSSMTEVADKINELRNANGVALSSCIVDEDGVGGGAKDILKCKGFVNNSKALNKENYTNLKSQCYFRMADSMNKNEVFICESQWRDMIIEELEQVKQKAPDSDGKRAVIPKEDVKDRIGRSPDFSDALAMRWFFELRPKSSYVR